MLLEWPKVIPPKGARKSRPERPPRHRPGRQVAWDLPDQAARWRAVGHGGSCSASVDDRRQATTQGISKRGNKYLRNLLIHGARAALSYVAEKDTALLSLGIVIANLRCPQDYPINPVNLNR